MLWLELYFVSFLRSSTRWQPTHCTLQFLRGRGFSGNTEQLWQKLPPAAFLPEDSPPSALSWMRRRLPGVPEGVLHRLFRKRDVKLISPTGARVAVRPDSKLLAGAVLAIPSSVQARERPDTSQTAGATPRHKQPGHAKAQNRARV